MAGYDSAAAVKQHLIDLGVNPNVANDESGYLYDHYSDPDEDINKVINQSLPSYLTRSNRPTASNGGVGGDADPDGDGIVNSTPVFGGAQKPRDGGASASAAQMDEIMKLLQGVNAQPDVDLSGITVNDVPNVEVQGENLSPFIDNTLIDTMEGVDPLGLKGRYADLLDRTAGGGVNSRRLQTRLEAARENLTRGEQGALGDVRGVLADRGLISTPGSPEGSELDATTRAFEPLQRAYLGEVRNIESNESDKADQAEMDALQQATGWTRDQVELRLSAANSAGERQQMMADIALKQLQQNASWNEFLANFGLQREQVAEQIRQGRIDKIMPVIQMFLTLAAQSRGGYI